MKKRTKSIIVGIICLIVGLLIGYAYIVKYFPFDINKTREMALLTTWSTMGWVVAGIFCFAGLCELFLDD